MGVFGVVLMIFLSCVCLLYLIWTLTRFVHKVWWTPMCIQSTMSSQAIKGPPYKFPHGSTKEITTMRSQSMGKPMEISHDIFSRIQPHVYSWTKIYELKLIKEILNNKEGVYPKMDSDYYTKKLLRESLITNEGEKWAKIRKLANHTFHAESLKGMIPEMGASVETMLARWKDFEGKEIDVVKEFGLLTKEVISRTTFGSSYKEGKHIFEMQVKLISITAKNAYNVRFPGISWLKKTNDEVEAKNLERDIKISILEIVKKRENVKNEEVANHFGDDYLGQLVKIVHESDDNKRITLEQMIDEIKTLFGAGHLTTTTLLAWIMFLLATHTDWQEKARKEVVELFGQKNPTSDSIARLKIMNMIINESLRLYPPAITMARKVEREVKLGDLILPANINIFFSILALHHNPQIWGKDVHLFKPGRFSEGVAKATNNHPAAFFPFGMGPWTCVGLNFSFNEVKIAISMILQCYKFTLSPNYVHYPVDIFLLTPKNGVQVIPQAI